MRHLFAAVLGTALLVLDLAPMATAQDEAVTADAAYGGFRAALVEDLAETRARLAAASTWIKDPDWYLVQTPDTGVVGVRRSRLADHAALLADPAFASRADLLDDPVYAWDEEFTMALSLISGEGGDPVAAAERLAGSLSQTGDEKQTMLRLERRYLRADRDELVAAIDAFDGAMDDLGIELADVAADDTRPDQVPAAEAPIDLLLAFRDELVADRVALETRIAGCRAAIDEDDVIALGPEEAFKFSDQLHLSDVVVFDLPTLPAYAGFPAWLRDVPGAWDRFDAIVAPDTARRTPLLGAMLLFSFWQDWPPGMRAIAQRAWPNQRRSAKADRSLCRPQLELLRPERDRLDTAIAALDEYLASSALDDEPSPQPADMLVPTPEPSDTPPPNPFADL